MNSSSAKLPFIVERATELFWRNGYEGVSIEDIVKETGVNRYALYQSFGGKKGIFFACIDGYCEDAKMHMLDLLAEPGKKAFDAIRESVVEKLCDGHMVDAGCLMTTTAVDIAPKDPEVAELMQSHTAELKAMLQASLSRAQAEGDIAPTQNLASISEIIFSLIVSAGVQARMGLPHEKIRADVDAAFCSLRYLPS
ncbi:MAG: TetR/AcrR family transcriptional regulator [Pseudomonadota bacterium]